MSRSSTEQTGVFHAIPHFGERRIASPRNGLDAAARAGCGGGVAHAQTAGRRTLVLSLRGVSHGVQNASAYEFEDTVAELEGAEIVSAGVLGAPSALEERVLGSIERHAGIALKRVARHAKIEAKGRYDLCFVRAMGPSELTSFPGLVELKRQCGKMVCWIEELWIRLLQYTKTLHLLDPFDHVFVGHASSAEPLSSIIDRPCHYLSPGVDALRFCPYPNPPARSIDVYMMGRRAAETHRRLLEHSRAHPNFFYLYDSAKLANFVEGAAQHRELVANLIRRTRYFVVNRAKMNAPDQTEGQQEFGPRYFEGAAGGAILIGDTPDSGPFGEFFDWPDAVFREPFGSSRLVELVTELDAQPERIERARRANVTNVLRRHDWMYRWQEILRALNLPPTPAMTKRKEELEQRAAAVEKA
jgi:hypothetical protein